MIGMSEICHRAQRGAVMGQESFDLDVVFPTALAMCDKYDITYDPQTPVPSDDALADRCYQAAVEFLETVGVYCPDTGSVIKFSRDEIVSAVANARGRCVMGEGKDRFEWTPRKPDSDTPPWYHCGSGIVNTDERIITNLVREYCGIEQANSISVPAVETIDGYTVTSGMPTEILGAIRGIKLAREAQGHAGRPGLAIGNLVSTAGTSMATIAASGAQFGLRPSDGWLVGALAEIKFNMGTLNKATFLASWGANIGNESGPLVGGYAGGAAGTAVLNVAYRLVGLVLLNCDYHLTFPVHVTKGCSTPRDVLWCVAVSNQAISRNTKELVWSLGYISAGPMTRQFFIETAAYVATAISSGVSVQTTHPARAVLNDYITPMEMRGSVEITEAVVGMTRVEANDLVKRLLPVYEDTIDTAPSGKKYQDCYSMATGKPCQEYVDLYGEVKAELAGMGLKFRA